MIKFENTEVVGWEHAIRGMRNPMNSWDKSDSWYTVDKNVTNGYNDGGYMDITIGQNDLRLMEQLIKAGTDHRKFMRMITVYVDITAPLYWWKEFDTYKIGTVVNSCSTMHKITERDLTIDDFSDDCITFDENLGILKDYGSSMYTPGLLFSATIKQINELIQIFKNYESLSNTIPLPPKKRIWRAIIQLLPSSYNQRRTVQMNYEVLRNVWMSRRNHKLSEWSGSEGFCDWVTSLPYCGLIVMDYSAKGDNNEEI